MISADHGRLSLLCFQKTGGALSSTDHQVLEHGYVTLLPSDTNGRPVLCCDASRLERDYTVECLRCFWYMLLAAAEAETKSESIVLLIVMNKLSFERSRWHPDIVTLLQLAPVRIEIHVVRQPARLGEKMVCNTTGITFFCLTPSVPAVHKQGCPGGNQTVLSTQDKDPVSQRYTCLQLDGPTQTPRVSKRKPTTIIRWRMELRALYGMVRQTKTAREHAAAYGGPSNDTRFCTYETINVNKLREDLTHFSTRLLVVW